MKGVWCGKMIFLLLIPLGIVFIIVLALAIYTIFKIVGFILNPVFMWGFAILLFGALAFKFKFVRRLLGFKK